MNLPIFKLPATYALFWVAHPLALQELQGRVGVRQKVGPPEHPALLRRQPLARQHLQEGQQLRAVLQIVDQLTDVQGWHSLTEHNAKWH